MTSPPKEASIGSRIKSARIARLLTVRGLARKAKVSHTTIYSLENGSTSDVHLSNAEAIASALGVSNEWLCFGAGREPKF